MENIKVEKIDNQGRGIAFINDKIAFIKGALPGDEVSVNVIKEKKKFMLCNVSEIHKPSSLRSEEKCPYSKKCGGCQFMDVNYEDSFELKTNSLKQYLKKNNINVEPMLIKNDKPLNYRNKLSLKIAGTKIGFYEETSNKIVEIKECMVASKAINGFIKELKNIGIQNGFVTIRSNCNDELLVNITTKEKKDYSNINVTGLIINHEIVKGEKFFVDTINDLKFEISYDSFFQINPYVTSELFEIINKHINKNDVVMDLYCGVGTLGISASKKAKEVFGLEIIKNAVINANNNSLINNCKNASFKTGDLSKNAKIKKDFDTLLIDPPRGGIDNVVMEFIKEKLPEKVIYVSCDYQTMTRDIKLLENEYYVRNLYSLDMFSYTFHLENVCVLYKK